MTVNLMYRQLVMKTFVQENWIVESFWQNKKFQMIQAERIYLAMCFNSKKALLSQQNNCMVVSSHSTLNYGLSGIPFFSFRQKYRLSMLFVVRFISNIINNPYSINYQALAIDTKRKKRRRNIAAAALTKKAYYNLKTLKLDLVLTVPFSFVNLFIYLFIYLFIKTLFTPCT